MVGLRRGLSRSGSRSSASDSPSDDVGIAPSRFAVSSAIGQILCMEQTGPHRRRFSRRAFSKGLAATGLGAGALSMPSPLIAASLAERFAASGVAAAPDHSPWTKLLSAYLRPRRDGVMGVAYARWKAEAREPLAAYLAMLAQVRVTALARRDQFAFWANLYNARTIALVLERYPVASIRDINLGGSLFGSGPWRAKLLSVEGVALSLDDVEHEILRKIWRDPRVHYAVNCASIGCPDLPRMAFTGATLEAMLERGAGAYVNHPRGVSVADGNITASRIYSWFAADFGNEAALLAHWRRYATGAQAKALDGPVRIGGYAYDWALNEG